MLQLSESHQLYLLKLSRQTLQEYLQHGNKPHVAPDQEELLEKRGAFVTLRSQGHLRGCIGYAIPILPLYKAVIDCSVAAATEDPRFSPLQLNEVAETKIGISVLSPLRLVTDILTIEVGTHGLVISHRGRRGLLLPQVPMDCGWDRERFLHETCRKAGLPFDEWKKGARIECFSTFFFEEAQIKSPGEVSPPAKD